MTKKIIYSVLFILLLVILFNLDSVKNALGIHKINLPADIQSVSSELITIDTQSSPKIILTVPLKNLNDSLSFIEHIQSEIYKNNVRINDVFVVITDTTETSRNEIVQFLEKNNVFLQIIVDSDNRVGKQFNLGDSTSVYVVSKSKLVWSTMDLASLKSENLKKLIRP